MIRVKFDNFRRRCDVKCELMKVQLSGSKRQANETFGLDETKKIKYLVIMNILMRMQL